MARWQLQCSGKPEEVTCKFCASRLPDWRATLFKDVVRASDDAVVPTSTSGSKKRNSMDERLLRSSADGDDQEAGTPGDEETDHEDGPGEIKGTSSSSLTTFRFDVRCARVLMGWRISCDKSESGVAFRRRR